MAKSRWCRRRLVILVLCCHYSINSQLVLTCFSTCPGGFTQVVPSVFVPTYEWQDVAEGQTVPQGLEVMNIDPRFPMLVCAGLESPRRFRYTSTWVADGRRGSRSRGAFRSTPIIPSCLKLVRRLRALSEVVVGMGRPSGALPASRRVSVDGHIGGPGGRGHTPRRATGLRPSPGPKPSRPQCVGP